MQSQRSDRNTINGEGYTVSSRIFQSVIVNMKDATERFIGVVDMEGTVVASSDLAMIGSSMSVPAFGDSDDKSAKNAGMTLKPMGGEPDNDYAVFAEGEDDLARTVCLMASVALNEARVYFEENNDKRAFVKNIISENILPGDLYVRAKELRFDSDAARGVLVIRHAPSPDMSVIESLQAAFPDKQRDFIISVSETDVALIKEMPSGGDLKYLNELAEMIEKRLHDELGVKPVIGIGTPSRHLRELSARFKEAQMSIDVGGVFDAGKTIISYESLGIGRLIYQLPTTLCGIFLSEVFKKNPIEALDQETLFTIDKFFENSLNVSETSRKLFIHRNTLVYRLEKIKKITGLDLREFDHAIIFKVALMVKKYLVSQESKY